MSVAGDQASAIKVEDGEAQKHEVTLEEALKLAQAHHRNGNMVIAERTYRDILRAVPDHFPTVHFLAALLFQRGNIDEALKFGKLATEVEPEHAACWSNYAAMLSSEGKYDEALDAYDQAIALNPELCETYVNKSHTLWLMERFEEAEEVAAHASLLDPDKPEALLNLGVALASQMKMDEAEEIWRQVVELDPQSAQAYSNWCNALRTQGSLQDAKKKGLKAIEIDPDNQEAYNNLGCVYRELGAFDDALNAFKKATDLKPDYAAAHLNTARTLLAMERHPDAIVAARYALSFKKDYMEAHITMSLALAGLGQFEEARQSAEKAINIAPEDPYPYLVMVDALLGNDQHDEAEAVLQKALELNPNDPEALIKLSEVRCHLDMIDAAVEALDKAIENYQETPQLLAEKARVLMHASRIDEGLEVIERALDIAPHNPAALLTKSDLLLTVNRKEEAGQVLEGARDHLEQLPAFYAQMASYKKYTAQDPDFIKLKAFEDRLDSFGAEGKSTICFALFSAYEQIGDYDKAFECLKRANDYQKNAHKLNPEALKSGFEIKKEIFTQSLINQYEGFGHDSEVPVFILGMPRSGTTLTEQILSSHPDIYGAGELYDLSNVIRECGPLTQESAANMGAAYVRKIKARDPSGQAKRVTDKMPGNFASIGLIHCILPKAKIIHCRRNPLDNLLSCYKQNFAVGQYWSYDLELMAQQYALYTDLMEHWRSILPEGTFIEIDYEETVNNFEEQARRLVDYVGLEWNDACLEPHKQKRAVLTASKDQVIRPVYKSSVAAWKRYETQLQPLVQALESRGIDIGSKAA